MAAATAKTRKDIFFLQLVGPRARLSESGFSVLMTIRHLLEREGGGTVSYADMYRQALTDTPQHLLYFSRDFNDSGRDFENSKAAFIMRALVCAWWFQNPADSYDAVFGMLTEPWIDKEEHYAVKFIIDVIHALRAGLSKDETYNSLDDVFKDCIGKPHWMNGQSVLGQLFRAWDAFYRAPDFGTAINNAMQLPGDPRVNAAIAGSMAEAMYGSLYFIRKKKYIDGDNPGVLIQLPQPIETHFAAEFVAVMRSYVMSQVFFPKNNSMTNIEWHQFENIDNPYYGRILSDDEFNGILRGKASDTEEDYGLYLDNGSFYVCRNWEIYCRFRVYPAQDGGYVIGSLQRALEFRPEEAENALAAALGSIL